MVTHRKVTHRSTEPLAAPVLRVRVALPGWMAATQVELAVATTLRQTVTLPNPMSMRVRRTSMLGNR